MPIPYQSSLDISVPRRTDMLIGEISAEAVEHGEVFTRRWIVELILDFVGYTPECDLATMTIVEPACGSGAFLGPMVERLSESCRRHQRVLPEARGAIRGFDLLERNVDASRRLVEETLVRDDWPEDDARSVVAAWVEQGDYLLLKHVEQSIDFVVGNPPYIRLEDVPEDRMRAYRASCPTMTGRADVYIGFFEVGLRSLRPGGRLGFICADRWMRNQYGRHLRRLIADNFSLDVTISMHDVEAFEEPVSAYPAVSVLHRGAQTFTIMADATRAFGPEDASNLPMWASDAQAEPINNGRCRAARLSHWFGGEDSWPAGSPARLAMIEELADRFPPLQDPATGTKVGIGVATGADDVFVTNDGGLVEPERLVPLAMVGDTASGALRWSGHYLVNPWDDSSRLVNLADYPILRRYYESHAVMLRRRHVATRLPSSWYRTIDKVDFKLTARPKLLLPDMKSVIHPVLDGGTAYPHHNLYYVVSDTWDLRVLGGLLLSRIANSFVEAYAVKMRGGTLRFQAQYLRRIRVPRQSAISSQDRRALSEAFERRDVLAATEVALRLYGLDHLPE